MRLLPKDPSLGWTRYVWLVYSLSLFVQPAITGTTFDWVVAVGSLAIFLPLYFWGFWLAGRKVLVAAGLILALGCVVAPINSSGAVFFIYASGFLGQVGRPSRGVRYLALILLIVGLEAWLIGIPRFDWAWAMLFSLLVGGINIHFAEVGRGQAKLQLAHDEVEKLATMAERERIARDLHDLLGHTLSLVTIKSSLAGRLVETDPDRARREIAEVESISREALAEVRRAVAGYRFLSLGAELAKAKVALAAAGIDLSIESSPYDLDGDLESAVALALREAVTNVVRHSGAERCKVEFWQAEGLFQLRVTDDGRGGDHSAGHGLGGMRERIEALGGTVAWEGSDGTTVRLRVPTTGDRTTPRAAAR